MWWTKSAERVLRWSESVVVRCDADIIFDVDIQHRQLRSCVSYVDDKFEHGIVGKHNRVFEYHRFLECYLVFEYRSFDW